MDNSINTYDAFSLVAFTKLEDCTLDAFVFTASPVFVAVFIREERAPFILVFNTVLLLAATSLLSNKFIASTSLNLDENFVSNHSCIVVFDFNEITPSNY
jgi:hypothetical protein